VLTSRLSAFIWGYVQVRLAARPESLPGPAARVWGCKLKGQRRQKQRAREATRQGRQGAGGVVGMDGSVEPPGPASGIPRWARAPRRRVCGQGAQRAAGHQQHRQSPMAHWSILKAGHAQRHQQFRRRLHTRGGPSRIGNSRRLGSSRSLLQLRRPVGGTGWL